MALSFNTLYRGDAYVAIEKAIFFEADRVNGNVVVPDGQGGVRVPRLSNAQVLAIVQGWRRAAARSRAPQWPESVDLALAALGWRKAGDRFDMTDEHMRESAPPELLAMLWAATKSLAERLDGSATKVAPVYLVWTRSGYEEAARQTWRTMQLEQAAEAEAETRQEATTKPSGGGMVILIALLIAAGLAARK